MPEAPAFTAPFTSYVPPGYVPDITVSFTSSSGVVSYPNVVMAGAAVNVMETREERERIPQYAIRELCDYLDNERPGRNPQQVEALRLERERRDREWEEYQRDRREAYQRARTLLLEFLTDEQRRTYEQAEWFEVVGSAGNTYRIHPGSVGNIHWRRNGEMVGRLCAHPSLDHEDLPDPDIALAQLLALKTDEPGFIRIANVHVGERPYFGVENVDVSARGPNYAA